MTGPELLDAVERLLIVARDCDDHDGIGLDLETSEALSRIPGDAIPRLRALLRTDEETAALRAALEWRKGESEEPFNVVASLALKQALDAIPAARREQIRKEAQGV